MWLSDLCIRRPVLACMMIGGLLVLGMISMGRVGIDLFPSVEFPYISIETTLDGASPGTVETEMTDATKLTLQPPTCRKASTCQKSAKRIPTPNQF